MRRPLDYCTDGWRSSQRKRNEKGREVNPPLLRHGDFFQANCGARSIGARITLASGSAHTGRVLRGAFVFKHGASPLGVGEYSLVAPKSIELARNTQAHIKRIYIRRIRSVLILECLDMGSFMEASDEGTSEKRCGFT